MSIFNISLTVLLARIIVLVTAIPVHEYAHAWAAERMGDHTARYNRRLSFNPLNHLSPLGAMMILFFGFGFAKPVPINSMNFTDRKKGIVVTSLAGPVSNILMATLSLILYKLLAPPVYALGISFMRPILSILNFMVGINLMLAVFNLLPIPPLDGWHALSPFLPYEILARIFPYEQYLIFFILLLIMMGVLTGPLSFLSSLFYLIIDLITKPVDLLVGMVF
jgi:Zn-dependent protease